MRNDTRSTRALTVMRVAGPLVLVAAAFVTLLASLTLGGGSAPLAIGDPGATVRWGLPIVKLLVNVTAATMVGSLALALFALQVGTRPFDVALDTTSIAAALFTLSSAVTAFLTFLNVIPAAPTLDPAFGQQLGRFLVETELGRAWLTTTVAGAVLTVLTFAVRGWTPTLFVAILAAASLVPMATQGHAGEEASHEAAVMSLVIHTLAAAVWLGGLILLVVVRPALTRAEMHTTLLRYSSIALAAFIVVALSGTVRASIGLGGWDALWSPYGALVLAKAVTLVMLGVLGAWYRRRLINRASQPRGSRRFWGVVILELAFMGIASGAAAALARTPTPGGNEPPVVESAAQLLTGNPVPPELTTIEWLTSTDVDPLWVLVAAFGLFFYLAGVRRLRIQGESWPRRRIVLWCSGLAALLWVTSGPINAYREYLFSVNALGLTLFSVVIPLLLVCGTPVTLALRAITPRTDGSRGGREWVLSLTQNPVVRILTHPFVAAGVAIVTLWGTYFTGIFRWALADPLGYEGLAAFSLLVGCILVVTFTGGATAPRAHPTRSRVVALVAVMGSYAVSGITIVVQSGTLVADWFGAMDRTWGASPLADQAAGGILVWAFGIAPLMVIGAVFVVGQGPGKEPVAALPARQGGRG